MRVVTEAQRASARRNRGSSNLCQAGPDAGLKPDLFGSQHSGMQALQATTLASAAQLTPVRVGLAAEVGLRHIALRSRQARLDVARHNLATQRYRSGLVDFQTVLETQRSQLATQDAVTLASTDVSAAPICLFTALGGGWVPDDIPVPR